MTPFKWASAHYGQAPAPATPYQRAAQAWDERIGSARVQARNWRLIALVSVVTTGGLAAALVVQSARGVVTPRRRATRRCADRLASGSLHRAGPQRLRRSGRGARELVARL
jgi:hypothetical protein